MYFCLDYLSTVESKVLKSPVTALPSSFAFRSINI